jgi:hypothetical protein
MNQDIDFGLTGLWVIGYLLFVWLTPAQFNLELFLIPTITLTIIELIHAVIIYKNNKLLLVVLK